MQWVISFQREVRFVLTQTESGKVRQQSRLNQPDGFEKIRVKVTQAEVWVEAGRRVPAAGQSRPSQEKSAEREVAAGLTTDLASV